jgi:hypothetical protein
MKFNTHSMFDRILEMRLYGYGNTAVFKQPKDIVYLISNNMPYIIVTSSCLEVILT